MSAPVIDRIVVEAAPGEVRAVGLAGDEAWDLALERPLAGPQPGDIYRARAGAPGPSGGRFFDMGRGFTGLARRPRTDWTEGAYGLVQVVRGEADDKGPRVTDRVWLGARGVEATLGASGAVGDRIEIARRIHHARRESLRADLEAMLPDHAAVRVSHDPGDIAADLVAGLVADLVARLDALAVVDGGPRRVHSAQGEVGWLVDRWPDAEWRPADLATAAWLAGLSPSPDKVSAPDPSVAELIDAVADDAMGPEIPLTGGARLWIEPTHALIAIDIDRAAATSSPVEVNRTAGREIARQLRLRRLGGIVAIDFLREGQVEGLQALRAFVDGDPWPAALPRSADTSGLVTFQRARLGASLAELAGGRRGRAYGVLRRLARLVAADPACRPHRIRAEAWAIELLREDLRPALQAAETRLGATLDLETSAGLGSIQVVDHDGRILDQA